MLKLTGTRLSVDGRIVAEQGVIVAANHSSYFDSLALVAALPGETAFVAKAELAPQFFAGTLLRRIGHAVRGAVRRDARGQRSGRRDRGGPRGAAGGGLPGRDPDPTPRPPRFQARCFRRRRRCSRSRGAGDAARYPVDTAGQAMVSPPRKRACDDRPSGPLREDRASMRRFRLRDEARAAILATCGEPDLAEEASLLADRRKRRPSPAGSAAAS